MTVIEALPWDEIKRLTLWDYEQLHAKLAAVLGYPVVWQHYVVPLAQSADMAHAMLAQSGPHGEEYHAKVMRALDQLEAAGITDWLDLLKHTNTRTKLISFIGEYGVSFATCALVFQYLLRYGLPFLTPCLQLVDADNPAELAWHQALKDHHLAHSFDLLQHGALPQQRAWLAARLGLPLDVVDKLVNRADLARLPFVRRKTLLALEGGGLGTLQRLACTPLPIADGLMQAYYDNQPGKSWVVMKRVITLPAFCQWAAAVPKIVQV